MSKPNPKSNHPKKIKIRLVVSIAMIQMTMRARMNTTMNLKILKKMTQKMRTKKMPSSKTK